MNRNASLLFFTVVLLVVASGASCPTRHGQFVQPAPIAFTAPPTLPEVIRVVNANSEPIRQLHTDSATLTIQGLPSLRASLAVERPRNLRLRAHFIGVGQVLDLGSNNELFWALVDTPELATNVPRAVYYARHDQFRRGRARNVLPIEPQWLIDALGVMRLDPTQVHEGPYNREPGRLEIRSHLPSPEGELTKVVVLDASHGWILEQHLYDAQGQLLVSAFASNHRYYPLAGASLPHHVEVRLPPPNKSIHLDVESYVINQIYSDPAQLWTMPTYDGYRRFDLGDPNLQPTPPFPKPSHSYPTGTYGPGYPATGYRPGYRGYSAQR